MATNILITGASRGIGAAAAIALHHAGARLILHHNTAPPPLAESDRVRHVRAALDSADGVDALIAATFAHERIDAVVNNAGIFEACPPEASLDDWRAGWGRTMQVNLQAAADLCRAALLHFRQHGGGRMINIASRAAYRGDSPAHWHYAASKAGMVAMTKSIARGYAAEGVLAFAVCPGFTMTGMAEDYLSSRGGAKVLADIPLGRVADADEVAAAIRFLCLDAPPSMTGAVIDINGASYVR